MSARALGLNELKQLIVESLQLEGVDPETIENDQPLFGGGLGLDSVDALELVVALEKKLGVKIPSNEIDADAFASVNSMQRFIEQRMAAEAGTTG